MLHDEYSVHANSWELFWTLYRMLLTQEYIDAKGNIEWNRLMDDYVSAVTNKCAC